MELPKPRCGATLAAELSVEGWLPGTSAAQLVLGAMGCPVDEDLCVVYRCQCGHQGMDYRSFARGDRFRAFAVCPNCDAAYEF